MKLTPVRNVSRQISQCHRKLRETINSDPNDEWLLRLNRWIVRLGTVDLKLRKLAYPPAKKAKQR